MKRRLFTLFIALLTAALLLAISGCSGKDAGTQTETKPRPSTVALIFPYGEKDAATQDEVGRELADAVSASAAKEGIDVSYYYADDNANKQSSLMSTVAAGETGVIVVIPVSGADLSEGLDAADKAGVPVVALHENIPKADMLRAYVGPDYGAAIGTLIETAAQSGKSVVFLNGPAGDKTSDAFAACITDDAAKIVNSDWTVAGATTTVTELLKTDTTLGALVTANASMARGAEKALRTAKLGDNISLYALNPSGLNANLITSGRVISGAVPDAKTEAQETVTLCAQLIKGESVAKNHLIPFLIIDKNTIDNYLMGNTEGLADDED